MIIYYGRFEQSLVVLHRASTALERDGQGDKGLPDGALLPSSGLMSGAGRRQGSGANWRLVWAYEQVSQPVQVLCRRLDQAVYEWVAT